MPAPTVGSFTVRLYEELKPLAYGDGDPHWYLLNFLSAISELYQDVYDYASDTDDGPGWSVILDLDRAPLAAVPWLAQFIGAVPPARLVAETDEEYLTRIREYVRGAEGFKRGTPAALKKAAQLHLTGNKNVFFLERDTSAYHLTITTLTYETPDAAVVNAALQAAKPGGLVLVHQTANGQLYFNLPLKHASYTIMNAAYATYAAIPNAAP